MDNHGLGGECADSTVVGLGQDISAASSALINRPTAGTRTGEVIDTESSEAARLRFAIEKKKKTVTVNFTSTEEELELLRKFHPNLVILQADVVSGPHGPIANWKKCEIYTVLDTAGIEYDTVFNDYGANPIMHILAGRFNGHFCCPTKGPRDAARRTEQNLILRRLTSPREMAKLQPGSCQHIARRKYIEDPDAMICRNCAEDCNHIADIGVFLHSTYDIPFDDLGKIMDAHQNEMCYGVFLFPEDALLSMSGTCPVHNYDYHIDPEEDEITFAFRNDPSFNYVHKWSELKKYVTRTHVYNGDNLFLYEITDMRGSAYYFKISRCRDIEGYMKQLVEETKEEMSAAQLVDGVALVPGCNDPTNGLLAAVGAAVAPSEVERRRDASNGAAGSDRNEASNGSSSSVTKVNKSKKTKKKEKLVRTMWMQSLQKKTIVYCPELIDHNAPPAAHNVRRRRVIVPSDFFNHVIGWAQGQENQPTLNSVYTFARGVNNRIVINGKTIFAKQGVEEEDLSRVATAVFFIDSIRRRKFGRLYGTHTELEKYSYGMRSLVIARGHIARHWWKYLLGAANVWTAWKWLTLYRKVGWWWCVRASSRRNCFHMRRKRTFMEWRRIDMDTFKHVLYKRKLHDFAMNFEPKHPWHERYWNIVKMPFWNATKKWRISQKRIHYLEGGWRCPRKHNAIRLVAGGGFIGLTTLLCSGGIRRTICDYIKKKTLVDMSDKLASYEKAAKKVIISNKCELPPGYLLEAPEGRDLTAEEEEENEYRKLYAAIDKAMITEEEKKKDDIRNFYNEINAEFGVDQSNVGSSRRDTEDHATNIAANPAPNDTVNDQLAVIKTLLTGLLAVRAGCAENGGAVSNDDGIAACAKDTDAANVLTSSLAEDGLQESSASDAAVQRAIQDAVEADGFCIVGGATTTDADVVSSVENADSSSDVDGDVGSSASECSEQVQCGINPFEVDEDARLGDTHSKKARPMAEVGDMTADEEIAYVNRCINDTGHELRNVTGDGNCLFRSLSVVLDGVEANHLHYRRLAVRGLSDPKVIWKKGTDPADYLRSLARPGCWSGHPEAWAVGQIIGREIVIYPFDSVKTYAIKPGVVPVYYDRAKTHYMAIVKKKLNTASDVAAIVTEAKPAQADGGSVEVEDKQEDPREAAARVLRALRRANPEAEYKAGKTDKVIEDRAIREYMEYLEIRERDLVAGSVLVYDSMKASAATRNRPMRLSVIQRRSQQEYKYDVAARFKDDYSRCVHDGKVKPIASVDPKEKVLVSASLKYPNPNEILRKANASLSMDGPSVRVIFKGIAGCGKTTSIMRCVEPDATITSPLRDSIREIQKELSELPKGTAARASVVAAKTIDSILINGCKAQGCDQLWIDEAYNCHSGAVFIVERFMGATLNVWCGDNKQIPPVNTTKRAWVYSDLTLGHVISSNITHRCPADAAAMMTERYGRKIKSSTGRKFGYSHNIIRGVDEVPLRDDVTYMTFHNSELDDLAARGITNVKLLQDVVKKVKKPGGTVHYFQGKTAPTVYLVRLLEHDKPCFIDMGYINVALTRHKVKCVYWTVIKDKICTMMDLARVCVEKGAPDQYMTSDAVRKFEMKGGGDVQPGAYSLDDEVETIDWSGPHNWDDNRFPEVDEVNIRNGGHVQLDPEEYDRTDRYEGIPSGIGMNDNPTMECPEVAIQMAIDELFPGHGAIDNTFDSTSVNFGQEPLRLEMDAHMRVGALGNEVVKMSTEMLVPKVRSLHPQDAKQTLPETLVAVAKRNANAPNTRVPLHEGDWQEEVWTRATNNLFRRQWRKYIKRFQKNRVRAVKENLAKWFRKQDEFKRKAVATLLSKDSTALSLAYVSTSRLQIEIKKDKKPMEKEKAKTETPASQTLTFSKIDVNMLFGGIIDTLHHRLLSLLKPNVCMVTDKSDADFTKFLRKFMSEERDFLEIDISKFDKSQTKELLDFEMFVYEKLGLDETMAEIYSHIYDDVQVDSFKVAFRIYLEGQRKSGAPTTLLGNTILNMFCLNYALNIPDFTFAAFKGDDSIIQGYKGGELNYDLLDLHWNFEAKPMITKYPFFCSCYIVKDIAHEWTLAPNPVKRMEAMGKSSFKTEEQLRDKYISNCDLMHNYNDPMVRENLAEAVESRLGRRLALIRPAIHALAACNKDYATYRKMWHDEPRVVHY